MRQQLDYGILCYQPGEVWGDGGRRERACMYVCRVCVRGTEHLQY